MKSISLHPLSRKNGYLKEVFREKQSEFFEEIYMIQDVVQGVMRVES